MARGSEEWVTSGMDVEEVEQKAKEGQLASTATDKEPAHPEDAGATADMKKTVVPDRMDAVPDIQEAPPLAKGDQDRAVDPETEDLGWSEDPDVPVPVVKGLKNEDLWVLVRRLNKQVYHVKALEEPLVGRLDLNVHDDDSFSPEKLRSTIERLYMSVFVPIVACVKHLARLRSWHERNRSAAFCAGYFIAWLLDLIMPAFFGLLLVLVLSPLARRILFPPIPLAAISAKSGSVKQPAAGDLGSTDSISGAAEQYRGEAVEQEATNFVSGITTLAVGTVAGKGAPSAMESEEDEEVDSDHPLSSSSKDGPDITNVQAIADAKTAAHAGGDGVAKKDKAKVPMEQMIWVQAKPAMQALNEVSDNFEMIANALSPTPPFHKLIPRLRLAGAVAPLLLFSLVTNETIIYKSTTLILGFAFWGQPVIDKIIDSGIIEWLEEKIPNWQKYLELRNSLLMGVPTNAQLAITLLRIGEVNKSPLPPPPEAGSTVAPETREPEKTEGVDVSSVTSQPKEAAQPTKEGASTKPSPPPKKGSTVLAVIRGMVKGGVETVLGADHVKATVGSKMSKTRLGVLRRSRRSGDGPTEFHARYKGKRGTLVISTTATTPCLSFEKLALAPGLAPEPVWSVQLDEISELRKVGGLGWKGKLVVGWATGTQIADGLEVTIKDGGKPFKLTAMHRRDEVFNRLISIGSQKWVSV